MPKGIAYVKIVLATNPGQNCAAAFFATPNIHVDGKPDISGELSGCMTLQTSHQHQSFDKWASQLVTTPTLFQLQGAGNVVINMLTRLVWCCS